MGDGQHNLARLVRQSANLDDLFLSEALLRLAMIKPSFPADEVKVTH